MGRPARSWPSTRALALLACATALLSVGVRVADGSPKGASSAASAPPATDATEFPPDFPSIGVRLIAVSLVVLLVLLLVAWIYLSRRFAAAFRRHFIREPPPDLVQRASWFQQNHHQLLHPDSPAGSSEEDGRDDDKLLSNFVTKYQSGQIRKTADGGKQPLTLFTLRERAGTSSQDRTGDARSDDDFYTPDGSYRGSAFMIPVGTSVSGSMMSVATWPSVVPLATATPAISATPASPPTRATGAPTLAVLATEALAAARVQTLESYSSLSDTPTMTASGTVATASSVPPTPSTPTESSPLTSVPMTPTRSWARVPMQSPPLTPTSEEGGNDASDPSVDVWLSPREMSADEDGPCSAGIYNMQRRRCSAGRPSSASTYGTTGQLTSDGSVDDWFSTQETGDERTDDERMFSAISEDLCGRLMTSSSASTSLALGRHLHLLSNDSMDDRNDRWMTAPVSPGRKTDAESERCASPNNVQGSRDTNRSAESARPVADANVQEPGCSRWNSASKAQP